MSLYHCNLAPALNSIRNIQRVMTTAFESFHAVKEQKKREKLLRNFREKLYREKCYRPPLSPPYLVLLHVVGAEHPNATHYRHLVCRGTAALP